MGTEETPEAGAAEDQPSEEELRARIEESLRDVRVQDVLLESVVTLINLTARRIGKPDEQDLEQARIGIEAVRGVADLLDPEPKAQVRNALSELQMLYAREAGGEGQGEPGEPGGGGQTPPAGQPPQGPPPQDQGPGRGGLWTPPGT